MKIIKEACVETCDEIDFAAKNKADRIELCSHLEIGGLTPTLEMIDYAISKKLNIAAMIRVNDNFCANSDELLQMQKQICDIRDMNICAFVFGLLTPENKIDFLAMEKLISCCGAKEVVFHMAFDKLNDKVEALEELAKIGVKRILTKGGEGKAVDNIEMLKRLQRASVGKIEIMAGGGITSKNWHDIFCKTQITQFHGRKIFE
ncbi:MAG: copper homeostasis protein CutC [Elusimicrobiota bacterium]|nr:copper homeostasis protein CutC [Elusimicrobiota bacterium]